MERGLRTVVIAGVVVVFVFFLGFGITSFVTAPENAIVLVEPAQKTYIAPSCIGPLHASSLPSTTIGKARIEKLKPDDDCRNSNGFTQEVRSLSGKLLEKIGILPPLPSRWNSDGTWNW